MGAMCGCGDDDVMNCFQGTEFEQGVVYPVWALCVACGDGDAMNCFQGTEFEQGVVYLVRALCDLECPEAVLGVYNWCRQIAGKKFAWVKAAAEKASER